jgi:dipeptidyl aminopeptidase/acylaminoacyl peptidase
MTQNRPLQPHDLYRLRLISDPQIAPDGSRVAFVLKQMSEEKNDYVSNVYVVDSEGTVTQFTSGDKDSAPRWSPDGRWLAFVSGRNERAQIHLLSTAGGESFALTDRKLGAGVPVWSPDSAWIAFTGPVSTDPDEEKDEPGSKDKDPKKPAKTKIVERSSYKADGVGYVGNRRRHLFLIDVAARKVEQLTDGDFHDDGPTWSPDGRHIAFSSLREDRWDVSTASDLYVIPREGSEARRLTSGGAYSLPTFSADGSRIAFVEEPDHETYFAPLRLASVDRSGDDRRDEQKGWDGEVGYHLLGDAAQPDDASRLIWRDDGIYFLGSERGETNVYRARNGRVKKVTHGSHAVNGWSVAADGTIACAISDPTHPAEIYLLVGDKLRKLTRENREFLDEVLITPPERFRFAGAGGEESDGWLLAPVGHDAGKHPLIAYIHGGPQFAYGQTFFFELQFLAGQGFGVFFPNLHGSGTYGRDYQLSIHGDWGNLDYQDVLAGTKEAATRPWVDSDRMGIIGGSYGGYMTAWVMGHTDLFKAGVTERCLCDVVNFFGTMDFGFAWNRATGAYPEEDFQKLWDMSPIKYVPNVKGPLMVIHSEGDDRTPVEQGEQMFNALRRLGKDTKFIRFPEESHGLSRIGKPSRRVERLGYILEWFREKL